MHHGDVCRPLLTEALLRMGNRGLLTFVVARRLWGAFCNANPKGTDSHCVSPHFALKGMVESFTERSLQAFRKAHLTTVRPTTLLVARLL